MGHVPFRAGRGGLFFAYVGPGPDYSSDNDFFPFPHIVAPQTVNLRRMLHGVVAIKSDATVSVLQILDGNAFDHAGSVGIEDKHHMTGTLDVAVISVHKDNIAGVRVGCMESE